MATCAGGRYFGEVLVIEVIPIDGTTVTSADDPEDFLEADWLDIGLINSKSYSLTFNSIDVTVDGDGPVPFNMTTGLAFETTVSGFAADEDTTVINQEAVEKFAVDAVNAGGCPKFWVRVVRPKSKVYAHCLATSKSSGGGNREATTFEMAFVGTATGVQGNLAIRIIPDVVVP